MQWCLALAADFHEVWGFERALGEENAVVGYDANRIAHQTRKATHDSRAIQCLEFVETAAIDQPRDNLAHIVALAAISGDDAIQIFGVVKRWFRRANLPGDIETSVEIGDDAATNGERVLVIDRVLIGDPRDTPIPNPATKFL